jgi:uncharacterized membrane protein
MRNNLIWLLVGATVVVVVVVAVVVVVEVEGLMQGVRFGPYNFMVSFS